MPGLPLTFYEAKGVDLIRSLSKSKTPMKRLLTLIALLILISSPAIAQPIGGDIETVAFNPIDWLPANERIQLIAKADVPCINRACRQVMRQDTLLILRTLTRETRYILAYMTSLNRDTGQPYKDGTYLVEIRQGQVFTMYRRDEWPPFLTLQEERISSPWHTFGFLWNETVANQ